VKESKWILDVCLVFFFTPGCVGIPLHTSHSVVAIDLLSDSLSVCLSIGGRPVPWRSLWVACIVCVVMGETENRCLQSLILYFNIEVESSRGAVPSLNCTHCLWRSFTPFSYSVHIDGGGCDMTWMTWKRPRHLLTTIWPAFP